MFDAQDRKKRKNPFIKKKLKKKNEKTKTSKERLYKFRSGFRFRKKTRSITVHRPIQKARDEFLPKGHSTTLREKINWIPVVVIPRDSEPSNAPKGKTPNN